MMEDFEPSAAVFAVLILPSYLLGSVAFGLVVSRFMKLGDIRSIGSGNIGASNVLRTGSKTAAAITLALDFLKGAMPVLLFAPLGNLSLLAGLAAFLGHLFPVWHRFRGGKGVATFLGVLFAFFPFAGIAAGFTWLAVAAATRISSCASLAASVAATLWVLVFEIQKVSLTETILAVPLMTVLIWVKHLSNIRRLIDGKEPKIVLKVQRD